MARLTYEQSGVNIEAGNQLARWIGQQAKRTLHSEVVSGVGGFAAMCSLPSGLTDPLIVSSTDGVGTKLKLAFAANLHHSVGIDLVAMCVNDLITVGAKPLFFLDYFATGKLKPDVAQAVMSGIVEGCTQARCALIGGETAELPGMYAQDEYDLAGFAVGIVERAFVIDGQSVAPGDAVIGLPSSGFHSNGFSLVRHVLTTAQLGLLMQDEVLGCSWAEALLSPTVIYVDAVQQLLRAVKVKAIAHITGGGLIENPPRVVPENCAFRFDVTAWKLPLVIQRLLDVARGAGLSFDPSELYRTFNMGIGLVFIVDKSDVDAALNATASDQGCLIGDIATRDASAVEFAGLS